MTGEPAIRIPAVLWAAFQDGSHRRRAPVRLLGASQGPIEWVGAEFKFVAFGRQYGANAVDAKAVLLAETFSRLSRLKLVKDGAISAGRIFKAHDFSCAHLRAGDFACCAILYTSGPRYGLVRNGPDDRHGPIWPRRALSTAEHLVFFWLLRGATRTRGGTRALEKVVVLVVEDEALIRMEAVQIVIDAGFAVVEASNADEAIEILQSRRDIRAVFTDINMSGSIDGLQLSHAIRGKWPPIHLIVTSGLVAPQQAQLSANSRFIGKPYTAEHVTAALRELFGLDPEPGQLTHMSRGCCRKVA
jgi:two-component system, response regulator PdtaR